MDASPESIHPVYACTLSTAAIYSLKQKFAKIETDWQQNQPI
ncbi:MAG TPA: hypothetical protein V6C57_24235 [Coleofasciculaceae cyanobacterium]